MYQTQLDEETSKYLSSNEGRLARLRRKQMEYLLQANDVQFKPGVTTADQMRQLIVGNGIEIPENLASIKRPKSEVNDTVDESAKTDGSDNTEKDVSEMSYEELKALATKLEIDFNGNISKVDLLEKIANVQNAT